MKDRAEVTDSSAGPGGDRRPLAAGSEQAEARFEQELVSVVLPTYRRSDFLQRSIDSVMRQSHSNWELVVVDDNEPESEFRLQTEKFMRRFEGNSRVRYLRHEQNKGGGAARNTGIRGSSGVFVAFLDDDDEWRSDKLEKQLARFAASPPDTAMIYSGFRKVFLDSGVEHDELPDANGHSLSCLLERNSIGTTSTILCRREALLEVGMFDENLPSRQDIDLYIRLARRYSFNFVNEPLVTWYRHGAGSIGTNRKRSIDAHRIFLDKYRSELERHPAAYRQRLFALGQLLLGERMLAPARDMLSRAWRLHPFQAQPLAFLLLANPLGFRFYRALLMLKSRSRVRTP